MAGGKMSTAWERLTPKEEAADNDLMLCKPGALGHIIRCGFLDADTLRADVHSSPIYLTDPELLALARKCPEVQALAKACRAAPTITVAELNALFPFEAPDATTEVT